MKLFSACIVFAATVATSGVAVSSVLIGDECTNAINLNQKSLPSIDVIETFNYTYNPNDPNITCPDVPDFADLAKSTWWSYTPSSAGIINVNTTFSDFFDSVIGVFSGSCTDLAFLICRERGRGETLSYPVKPGITYYFKVTEYGELEFPADGDGVLNFRFSFERNYLTLINPVTDKTIGVLKDISEHPIQDPGTIDYSVVNTSLLSIESVFNTNARVKSVRLTLDNPRRNICENKAPFTLFGSVGKNIQGQPIQIGNRVVNATAFSQSQCKGRQIARFTESFTVLGCSNLAYYLYDAPSRTFVTKLHNASIVENPPCRANVEVSFTCGFKPKTVRIELRRASNNAIVKVMTEKSSPYFLYGDDGKGKLLSGKIPPGEYTLRAIIDGIVHPYVQFSIGVCSSNRVDNKFNIDLSFGVSALSQYENAQLFTTAARRVSSLVIGDKPDIQNTTAIIPPFISFPPTVDDLYVQVDDAFFSDGPGGFMWLANLDFNRESDGLPFAANVAIDVPEFLNVIASGDSELIESFLLQIMIEVLGFGPFTVWETKGLAEREMPCSYKGTRAVAEFNAITGYNATTIPLGRSDYDSFFDCVTWDESCLMNEILSQSIGIKKISRITLGAMEDMGYVVNYTAADPYDIDDIGAGCSIVPTDMQVRRRRTKETVPVPTSKSSCRHEGDAYKKAVQHGMELRRKMYESHEMQLEHTTLPDGLIYVGNQRSVVTYQNEDGSLCTTTIPPL